jgi:hypothetical protein
MELVTKLQKGKMQQKVEDYELYRNIIYVPNSTELRSTILKEMHNLPYVGHPGYQKKNSAAKSQYYWPGVKRDIVEYIDKFLECQRFKAEHRHPTRLLHPFYVPK